MLCIENVVGIEKHVTALMSDNAIVGKILEIRFEYSLKYYTNAYIFFPKYLSTI